MFPRGTKVFYWNGTGQTVYGTVQQVEHMEDGTMVVKVRDDNGQTVACLGNNTPHAQPKDYRTIRIRKADLPFHPRHQVTGSGIPCAGSGFLQLSTSQPSGLSQHGGESGTISCGDEVCITARFELLDGRGPGGWNSPGRRYALNHWRRAGERRAWVEAVRAALAGACLDAARLQRQAA
ncbi:hypothetical protein B0H14DRAFT_3570330 [Mycena olivaceomarginata]|nr:hypothetical protein B0H14DRAFT_3570330 [Mycena olivaceomarginata]